MNRTLRLLAYLLGLALVLALIAADLIAHLEPGDSLRVDSPDTIYVNGTPASTLVVLSVPTRTPTVTPTPTPKPVTILCDGQTFDGFTTTPFKLNDSVTKDPTVQKVIRNCIFKNGTAHAIVIQDAQNVLIEGNTFENIRTNEPGIGVHAINLSCGVSGGTCAIDNITIRRNTFRQIGADGIQLGANNRQITNVVIDSNLFEGSDSVGENGIDVKGVDGPVLIAANRVHGFRPCESPKTTPPGTQDCSGSPGEGIVIHDGGAVQTPAQQVTVLQNEVDDNVFGIVVSSGATDIVVKGNFLHDNLDFGLLVNGAGKVTVEGNTFGGSAMQVQGGERVTLRGNLP